MTDGRTDILPRHSPRYAYASRGKKWYAYSTFNVSSVLFSSGQTAVKLSGAETANRAQCAAPDYWNLLVVFADLKRVILIQCACTPNCVPWRKPIVVPVWCLLNTRRYPLNARVPNFPSVHSWLLYKELSLRVLEKEPRNSTCVYWLRCSIYQGNEDLFPPLPCSEDTMGR